MVNKKLFIINCQLPIILRVFVTPCLEVFCLCSLLFILKKECKDTDFHLKLNCDGYVIIG